MNFFLTVFGTRWLRNDVKEMRFYLSIQNWTETLVTSEFGFSVGTLTYDELRSWLGCQSQLTGRSALESRASAFVVNVRFKERVHSHSACQLAKTEVGGLLFSEFVYYWFPHKRCLACVYHFTLSFAIKISFINWIQGRERIASSKNICERNFLLNRQQFLHYDCFSIPALPLSTYKIRIALEGSVPTEFNLHIYIFAFFEDEF